MRLILGSALLGALSVGCGAQTVGVGSSALQADIIGLDGATYGRAEMSMAKSGRMLLKLEARGLPSGAHGFHIHETGKCNPRDNFESAGGHLSGGAAHGVKSDDGMHIGDLPNLYAPESGEVRVEYFLDGVVVDSGPAPLMDMDGAALVIHAVADDYATQPSGAAGARIACGVIERVQG